MGNGKLHVEIGMDGDQTVSVMEGNGLELLAAARRCINLFYQTLKKGGSGDFFKNYIRDDINNDDSLIWTHEDSGMEGEAECGN